MKYKLLLPSVLSTSSETSIKFTLIDVRGYHKIAMVISTDDILEVYMNTSKETFKCVPSTDKVHWTANTTDKIVSYTIRTINDEFIIK